MTDKTTSLVERFAEIVALSEQPLVFTVEDNRSPGAPDQSIYADELLALIEQQAATIEAMRESENDVRRFAGFYKQGSDGRNTLLMLADQIAARAALKLTDQGEAA